MERVERPPSLRFWNLLLVLESLVCFCTSRQTMLLLYRHYHNRIFELDISELLIVQVSKGKSGAIKWFAWDHTAIGQKSGSRTWATCQVGSSVLYWIPSPLGRSSIYLWTQSCCVRPCRLFTALEHLPGARAGLKSTQGRRTFLSPSQRHFMGQQLPSWNQCSLDYRNTNSPPIMD